jgi:hypothetical protein
MCCIWRCSQPAVLLERYDGKNTDPGHTCSKGRRGRAWGRRVSMGAAVSRGGRQARAQAPKTPANARGPHLAPVWLPCCVGDPDALVGALLKRLVAGHGRDAWVEDGRPVLPGGVQALHKRAHALRVVPLCGPGSVGGWVCVRVRRGAASVLA